MIDYFAIGLTHGLLALALLRLAARNDLDSEDTARRTKKPWHRPPADESEAGGDA